MTSCLGQGSGEQLTKARFARFCLTIRAKPPARSLVNPFAHPADVNNDPARHVKVCSLPLGLAALCCNCSCLDRLATGDLRCPCICLDRFLTSDHPKEESADIDDMREKQQKESQGLHAGEWRCSLSAMFGRHAFFQR
jgi:hypothetical protein